MVESAKRSYVWRDSHAEVERAGQRLKQLILPNHLENVEKTSGCEKRSGEEEMDRERNEIHTCPLLQKKDFTKPN